MLLIEQLKAETGPLQSMHHTLWCDMKVRLSIRWRWKCPPVHLFPAVHLLNLANVPTNTIIPTGTTIQDSRVIRNITFYGFMSLRVVQIYIVNLKHQKFVSDFVNYYFLGQKHSKNVRILKTEQLLDVPISKQSFST